MRKVFLLEDDLLLNETIVEYLEENSFEVVSSFDGSEAHSLIYENNFDILILDVNVPSLNGFELLKRLREENIQVPAIFTTSLNSISSFEEGYSSGCDDYIRKPFELKELLIRIESILQKGYFHQRSQKISLSSTCYYDSKSDFLYQNDEIVSLNPKESKLIKYFLKNQDELISHERIYDYLWEFDESYSDAALRTYIKNLRKIIGKDRIISVKKLGYRFSTK